MRSFVFSSLAALAAAVSSPLSGQEHTVETIVPPAKEAAPIITAVELNRAYAIRLGCTACPFGVLKSPHAVEWLHPPPDSSLMLMLTIGKSGSALLLNDEQIFPLNPSPPPSIHAMQAPTDVGKDAAAWQADHATPERIRFPLQYQHTLFRAEGEEGLWLQFNVTGLAWGESPAPFKMGHQVLQILLRESHMRPKAGSQGSDNTHALLIADVQVVGEEDRAQPPRMKCGRLAMIQTTFDPNEWDQYGKFGTWARTRNLMVGNTGAFLSGCLHCIDVLVPLLLLLATGIAVARCQSRQQQQQQQDKAGGSSAAETSLLGSHAAPPYVNLPVIKIEQYD